jgi:hypothetical protein
LCVSEDPARVLGSLRPVPMALAFGPKLWEWMTCHSLSCDSQRGVVRGRRHAADLHRMDPHTFSLGGLEREHTIAFSLPALWA